jgi:hypothetical protein
MALATHSSAARQRILAGCAGAHSSASAGFTRVFARALLLLIALLVYAPEAVFACRCPAHRSFSDAYARAESVVTGKVSALQTNADGNGSTATVIVSQSWKAQAPQTISVSTSTTCAFNFVQGEEYLLYLYQSLSNLTRRILHFEMRRRPPACKSRTRAELAETPRQGLSNPRGRVILRPATLMHVLDFLLASRRSRFASGGEQGSLRRSPFPSEVSRSTADEGSVQHRLFVERVAQFRRNLETGFKDALLAVVAFLKDWPELRRNSLTKISLEPNKPTREPGRAFRSL